MKTTPLMLAAACAVLALVGCRTTDGRDKDPAPPPPAQTQGTGLGASLELAKPDDQSLYLKMLGVELKAGAQVPEQQLHTSRGLLECRHDGLLNPCTLRVRLAGDELSATQPVSAGMAADVWSFVRRARPDMKDETAVVADVACDYIGKKSPPYKIEEVHCNATLPRAKVEAVFDDPLSAEMSEALRGDASYGGGLVTLSGTLTCQWLSSSPRTPCIVRAFSGSVLSEKFTEVSAAGAQRAAKLLMRTVRDAAKISGGDQAGTPGSGPGPAEISSALICQVDDSKTVTGGQRSYLCRARI